MENRARRRTLYEPAILREYLLQKRHKKQTGREIEKEGESGGAIESLMGREGREEGRKETDKGSKGRGIREREKRRPPRKHPKIASGFKQTRNNHATAAASCVRPRTASGD